MAKASETSGYLTIDGAAAYCHVSSHTMKRYIAMGLPTCQAGTRTKVLLRPVDIDAFLTRHQKTQLSLSAMVDEVSSKLFQPRN